MFTTEVTSSKFPSDHPLLLRTKTAYDFSEELINGGSVLEIGCGEGYGLRQIYHIADELFLIDRSPYSQRVCAQSYPKAKFFKAEVPSLNQLSLPKVDYVICFQFIEHIQDPKQLLKEATNLLKPGGKLIVSTPNAQWTKIQNPWHVREFDLSSFTHLLNEMGGEVTIHGVNGSEKSLNYFIESNRSAERIARLDFLKLHQKLPLSWHRFLYDRANRFNRKNLQQRYKSHNLSEEDYTVGEATDQSLDYLSIVTNV